VDNIEVLAPTRSLPTTSLPTLDQLLRIPRILKSCVLEARPTVQGIFMVRFLTGLALVAPIAAQSPAHMVAAVLIWYAAILYVYLINGASDVVEDKVNNSRRPIARGLLSADEATVVARTCAVLSVVGAYYYDNRVLLMPVLAMIMLGHLYSVPPFAFKRWSGASAVTSGLGGLLTYDGGALAANGHVTRTLMVVTVVMSLWMGMVGTQAKDLSDVNGDRAAGRQTFAVLRDERWVRLLLSGTAAAVATGFLIAADLTSTRLLVPAALLAIGAVALAAATLRGRHEDSRSRRRLPYRIFMISQYSAHLSVLVVFFLAR